VSTPLFEEWDPCVALPWGNSLFASKQTPSLVDGYLPVVKHVKLPEKEGAEQACLMGNAEV